MNRRLLYVLLPLICLALLAGCQERSVNVDHHANATDDDQADDDAGSTPWDNEPARPLVTIQQPTPGEFFADATAPVSGEVTGVPVTQVFVNDQPVAVQDGHFQTTVSFAADQQVLPIYVLAKTDDGRFGGDRVVAMRGEMRAPEKNIDDALRVGLGDDVFTVIGAAVAQLFQNLDLGPIFASLNPIIDFLGITVDITAATIGGAQFSGEFTDQGLHIFGELTDVTLTADVTAFGNTSTTTITIGTLSLDMLADVLFKDGSVAVTVSSINAAHSDVTYDGPLPALLGKAGTDLLLGAIEGVVELLGRDLLPNLLSQWILTAVLDTVQIGFDIHAGLTSLDIGPGAAMAGLALNVFLTDPNPEPWPYGSLFTPGAPPDMLFARPPAAQSFGVALALSANFLNRFLFSAAEAELLNFAVGDPALVNDALPLPLTAGVLAGLMPAFGDIDPDESLVLVMKLFGDDEFAPRRSAGRAGRR